MNIEGPIEEIAKLLARNAGLGGNFLPFIGDASAAVEQAMRVGGRMYISRSNEFRFEPRTPRA